MVPFMVTALAGILFLTYLIVYKWQVLRKYALLKKLYCEPGATFFLGHFSLFKEMYDHRLSMSENGIRFAHKYFDRFRAIGVTVAWFTWVPYIIISNAKALEEVLSSSKVMSKSKEYQFFEPWIGTGLLTSEPKKWKVRRKLLTPTFHFRILEDFLKSMNEHSMISVDIIKERSGTLNLFEVIPLTTLDTICETAMGINVNAQRNPKSKFVNAICFVNECIFSRMITIPFWSDLVFSMSPLGSRFRKEVDFIHEFSRGVIDQRKTEMISDGYPKGVPKKDSLDDAIFFGSKRRKIAFIDLLIREHLNHVEKVEGQQSFTVADVCEEVDTFMFEGFETTAAAICWTLHLLGNHEGIQTKAYEEVFAVFGSDTDKSVTVDDLNRLKYVECCIKEALRLYPPVPLIGRYTTEEIDVCGHRLPTGVTLVMYMYALHRDEKYFPDPDAFIPERFLDENNINRNPYAYIPFSAGPRNCIGQRFAMYEMKTIVTNILRQFTIRSERPTNEIAVSIEIITRRKSPLNVYFGKRSF